MKFDISTSALLAATATLFEFSEGAALLNYGTYTEDFEESCPDVISANEFYGDCCSFSDIDEQGKKCRLTVAGEDGSCGWNNKKYMKDCEHKNEGCLPGPHISVIYDNGIPVEECPDTSFPPTDVPTKNSDYDVTYAATEACPSGSITALVRDDQGKPVAGKSVGFLIVGESSFQKLAITDANGYAKFEFTVSHLDAGETLWCSMAVENPNYGTSIFQQVPCSVSVCGYCAPTTSPFDAGYGPCETYAKGNTNSDFCSEDYDRHEGLYADHACAECGGCIAEPPATTTTCPTYKPENGGECDWEVLGGCGYDCCCDSDKTGTCISRNWCVDGSIIEAQARIIGCSNFGCDAQGNPV